MDELEFVNGCGDQYLTVPTNFVPDINRASSKAFLCVIGGIVQIGLTLLLCLTCAVGGRSEDHDDSDDEKKYDQLDQFDNQA